ncbi:MAG: CDP-6-deoxy-delta-3,4-glucoseen reductase [Candidatus Nitrotoga sp.]|nr:CDP-6-deoxy-delta-3,4-glucoseen reductase [Candidatus Nitrotoga sp.]MDW7604045.1 CDP-6-deoxy-delta-3,4-glucoseen reductase [Candidatus Nitrotoga sp.]MDW7612248.1 CDP-6-deoxy-delta-3,4-glucoseen reductase [Candidatus Nitrotoga sp.]
MTFNILVKPSNHSFTIDSNETILEAGLRHGFIFPYSCRDGVCGTCKGMILQGTVDYGEYEGDTLNESEKARGMALFCRSKPTSDLVIECNEVSAAKDIPIRTMPCRIHKLDRPTDDVMIVHLKLPANERLQFLAGQYINILMKGGKVKSYSLASPPHNDEFLQLHVRNVSGGEFTKHVFTQMKERDILRFKGPMGTFFLREDSTKPIILVASGTGFAPIKSIIEHALHIGLKRSMHFYWGALSLSGLYMLEAVKKWEPHGIKFTPVLSEAMPADQWEGRSGFVHTAVMEDHSDLSGYQVYACGAPIMVESARRDFVALCRLPNEEFFSDAFITTYKA